VNVSVRPFVPERVPARPAYEGFFGLLLVAVMLLSTLDDAALAPLGRGLLLGCFALLAIVNVGAALGVYIGAALLFSLSISSGQFSWVQRPDNFALLFLTFYLVAGRCFTRSAGRFGSTAVAVALLLLTTVTHLVALVGVEWYWLAWFARMFAIPLGLFVLLRRAALSPGEVRALLLIAAVLGVYLAAVTLLEVLGGYDLIIPRWLADPEVNPYFGSPRVGGVEMQPEWNALDISLGLCVLLLHLMQRRTPLRTGWLAGAGLCLVAIYFTYTRGAWLGLLFAGVPLLWQRTAARAVTLRRRVLFVTGVVGFAAFLLFFPTEILEGRASDSGTMYFRLSIWLAGLGLVAHHPLFGVGFGQFGSHIGSFLQEVAWIPSTFGPKGGTIAHNTLLSVAAELGLVGLALYVLAVAGVYLSARAAAGAAWGRQGQTWVTGYTLVYHINVQFITAHWLSSNILYFGVMGAIAGMRGSWATPARFAGGTAAESSDRLNTRAEIPTQP
jgi:O-antigen ligase